MAQTERSRAWGFVGESMDIFMSSFTWWAHAVGKGRSLGSVGKDIEKRMVGSGASGARRRSIVFE